MQIFRHTVIDSTSSEALRLMAQSDGPAPPFAVIAAAQDAGRGRQGRSWSSPPGNIYLSIALPTGKVPLSALVRAPLFSAVIAARFIADTYGVRPTLKWPNDLLFAGRKLGGILCETSAVGSQTRAVIVGIGVNVASAPVLHDENRAIALADILGCGTDDDAMQLAARLAHYFVSSWDAATMDERIAADYDRFAIEPGQLWRDPTTPERFLSIVARHANGHLVVQNPDQASDREELYSVQRDYHWIYQGPLAERYPLLAMDLGNSQFKAALFGSADRLDTMTLSVRGDYTTDAFARLADFRQWLDDRGIRGSWPVHVASVNREMEQLCASQLRTFNLVAVEVPRRPVRLVPSGYDLAQLGIDRLALMEGALARVGGQASRPIIVVSIGTATTIDVIDSARSHQGGVILPGLAMRLNALAKGGSLLPQLTPDEAYGTLCDRGDPQGVTAQIGHDTREAIGRGAFLELTGALARLRESLMQATPGQSPDILLSGGHAGALAPRLAGAIHLPELALKGIAVMVRGG